MSETIQDSGISLINTEQFRQQLAGLIDPTPQVGTAEYESQKKLQQVLLQLYPCCIRTG